MTNRSMGHADESTGADAAGTSGFGRRTFMAGGLVGAGALVLAACGGNDNKDTASKSSGGSTKGTTSTTAGNGAADLEIAMAAAGLEALAVGTYKSGLDAATGGKLGAVPPAVAEFAKTAMAHHEAAMKAWNDVLATASKPAVTEPNATLKPKVDAQFAQVKDVAGLANLALMLEEIAADTYLKAVSMLQSKEAIKLAGSIQVIDQQHRAVLLYALGQYPVPETFQQADKAAI